MGWFVLLGIVCVLAGPVAGALYARHLERSVRGELVYYTSKPARFQWMRWLAWLGLVKMSAVELKFYYAIPERRRHVRAKRGDQCVYWVDESGRQHHTAGFLVGPLEAERLRRRHGRQ